MATAKLEVRLFDGGRRLMADASKVFVRVLDGNQQQYFAGTVSSAITVFDVPFFDNPGDNYAVLASRDGYVGAGYHGITVALDHVEPIDLMLMPIKHRFNFAASAWPLLQQSHANYCQVLSAITKDADVRWGKLVAADSPDAPIAADVLNILTAMRDIHLAVGTPLDYLKAVDWTDPQYPLQQDRFYVWIDPAMINEVRRAASQGFFDQEPNPAFFHKGATLSYKENQLAEANVQLTFHENTKCSVPGFENCILMEPDIDYYPDLLSHGLLEVVPGFFSLTDPRLVYVMRWIASRRVAGVHEFDPPYTIEAV